jgi:formamidopyrimidine-DNA glycosylase
MPELPEVDDAAQRLSRAVRGKTIRRLTLLHPAVARFLSRRDAERLRGLAIRRVVRRGKHQLLELSDGSTLCVHFRMSGDWSVGRHSDPRAPFARMELELTDGARVALVDPRALATVRIAESGEPAIPELGPDALDPNFGPRELAAALTRKRSAIKPALLDQRVVAGLGNIYAAEALWQARISPFADAARLGGDRLRRIVSAIRLVLTRARRDAGRYSDRSAPPRFRVYGRAGEPCPRCGTPIERVVQVARSTYYCPRCQRR